MELEPTTFGVQSRGTSQAQRLATAHALIVPPTRRGQRRLDDEQ